MGVWIPIDPNLDKAGAYTALAHLPRAGELKPKPLPADQEPFGTWWANGSQLSVSVASRLGLAGVVDRSSSYRSMIITYDVALYSEVLDPQPNGDVIYGTRWGAGLRTRVTVYDFDFKTSLSLGSVAAASSLGMVDASYQVEGIGLSTPEVLKLLPDPGRFDANSHAKVMGAIEHVVAEVLTPKKNLTPMPFMIYVSNTAFVLEPVERARSFLYGARAVARQNDLRTALAKADPALDPVAIRSVYGEWCAGTPDAHGPSPQSVEAARQWLARCGLTP